MESSTLPAQARVMSHGLRYGLVLDKTMVFARRSHWTVCLANRFAVWRQIRRKQIHPSTLPIRVMVEPTNLCNLACPTCTAGLDIDGRPKGSMSVETYRRIIDQVKGASLSAMLWNLGEPLLNRDIVEMCEYSSQLGIWTWTCTNGCHFGNREFSRALIRSGLHYIMISLDGATQTALESFRVGAKLTTILESLRVFMEERRRLGRRFPIVEIQFLEMKDNQDELPLVEELAAQLGISRVSTMKLGIPLILPNFKELAERLYPEPINPKMVVRDDRGWYLRGPAPNYCARLLEYPVISWEGNVHPCSKDLLYAHPLGNIHEQSLEQIWFGEPYRRFRDQVAADQSRIDICRTCPDGRPWNFTLDPRSS
jgi:radical SAM protein with 4Fe4S-binding SPASM domain